MTPPDEHLLAVGLLWLVVVVAVLAMVFGC